MTITLRTLKLHLKILALIFDTSSITMTDFSDHNTLIFDTPLTITLRSFKGFRPHPKTLTPILDTFSTTTTFQSFRDYFIRSWIYDSRFRSRNQSQFSVVNIRFAFGERSAHDDRLIRFHRYPQREATIVRQKFVFRPASTLHDRQQAPRVQRIED